MNGRIEKRGMFSAANGCEKRSGTGKRSQKERR